MNRRNKHFPPAAICDKDGRPLLSWRVAILPYIDQEDLYKQFHLDEPWDSPHNRSLIEKMPGTYMDLGPKADQLNHEGKTTVPSAGWPTNRVLQKRRHEIFRNHRWHVQRRFWWSKSSRRKLSHGQNQKIGKSILNNPERVSNERIVASLLQLLPTATSK